jgi:hypothetical protein
MGEIVYLQSRRPIQGQPDDGEMDIDLLTAVDVALRDLADITQHISLEAAREQAEICRRMLKAAFDTAVCEG